MNVPLDSLKFDLSTEEGCLAMLNWITESDKEAEILLRKIAETQKELFRVSKTAQVLVQKSLSIKKRI